MYRKHFQHNVTLDLSEKFILRLTFRDNMEQLGEPYKIALKRFLLLERRLVESPERYNQYKNFMTEYESV